MELDRGLFPKLLVSVFVIAVVGFFVRGFSQLVVGVETARRLAAPFFLVGVVLAAAAFVLSVLVKLGLISDQD